MAGVSGSTYELTNAPKPIVEAASNNKLSTASLPPATQTNTADDVPAQPTLPETSQPADILTIQPEEQ